MAGWQANFGKPQPRRLVAGQVGSIWDAQYGGVGVLGRVGVPMQEGTRDTDVRRRLWESGRWCHAVMGYGNGGQAVHVMSLYGCTGGTTAGHGREHIRAQSTHDAATRTEELLQWALEAAAELGNAPVLLMGDFNIKVEDSAVLSPARLLPLDMGTGASPDPLLLIGCALSLGF